MSVKAEERLMVSERIAPGMLPRVLSSFDMTIIFVAIVLFIINASALQPAGQSAFTLWILGFVVFLIPGALVTAQLGQMFPHEGSLYVWTQKALGPFWGFFAGFCAWWPGILVMVAIGDAVVTIWQFVDVGSLSKSWEQGLVILAVLWFSAGMSIMRLRFAQSYVNIAVVFYGGAVFVIGLAGILWLIGSGHAATKGWGQISNYGFPSSGSLTLFGLVILALLGIEVPLNMGVEIVHMRSIRRYLLWGSIAVMAAYLWATLGTMLALDASKSQAATTDILRAVQVGFWGSHALAVVVGLILIWFFVSNTIVFNYAFSRLLFVSGLERRMPRRLGRVSARNKVPVHAIITQTVLSSLFVVAVFNPGLGSNNTQKAYFLFQAGVTVIWCLSMVLLFSDIFLVRRAFPDKFDEVRAAHPYVLYASGVIGLLASAFGAFVTFRSPWTPLFSTDSWRVWLAALCGVSALGAVAIYAVTEFDKRRALEQAERARSTQRRIIEAADAARRQLARDLHDGAQQHFVNAVVNMQLARHYLDDDPERARHTLGVCLTQAQEGIQDLRRLSIGIHPAILVSGGLEAAVEGLAERMPIPVEVTSSLPDRLPDALEASVYFVISEALTNVVKHARATHVTVKLARGAGRLLVEVSDDGIGGVDLSAGTSGITGLIDRVEALAGSTEIASAPGRGTTIRVEVPLDAADPP